MSLVRVVDFLYIRFQLPRVTSGNPWNWFHNSSVAQKLPVVAYSFACRPSKGEVMNLQRMIRGGVLCGLCSVMALGSVAVAGPIRAEIGPNLVVNGSFEDT